MIEQVAEMLGTMRLKEVMAVAKAVGWQFETFLQVLSAAITGFEDVINLNDLEKQTDLLPTKLNTLCVRDLMRLVPRARKGRVWDEERLDELKKLRWEKKTRVWDDEVVLKIWPARTKMDLAIRRTRLKDTWRAYYDAGEEERFWFLANKLPDFDIISVTNFLNTDLLLSTKTWSWFDFFDKLGAFDEGVEHYREVTKVVNNLAKTHDLVGLDRSRICECSGLTGYRNPPVPGFDKVKETENLANGGNKDNPLGESVNRKEYRKALREALAMTPPTVEWIDFEDYVISGEWKTAGSSSIGKVEWEWGDEHGSFKARKNQVPYIMDLKEEAAKALMADKQVNVAIIKSELGKVRMAVASDIYQYWQQAWLLRLLGGAYKQWEGNTLEETVAEQTKRMIRMLKVIADMWNLPFDYESFDHQPTLVDLLDIVEFIRETARVNVPYDKVRQYELVTGNIIAGFKNATLSVVDDQVHKIFKVVGGLMSGLRMTSVIGNAWNSIKTRQARNRLEEWMKRNPVVAAWLRGDDSALVFKSYADALMFREMYDAVGAKGGEGKFGIHFGQSEFLRVWYSRKASGYLARAIPTLSQRKPWSSVPWDEASVMAALYVGVNTMKRRGADEARMDTWWRAVKLGWSQRNHVSQSWLGQPKDLGGLGVEPWDGRRLLGKWEKVEMSGARINIVDQAVVRTREKYAKFDVSRDEAEALTQREAVVTLTADDIPSVNSALHKKAKTVRPSIRIEKVDQRVPMVYVSRVQAECKAVGAMKAEEEAVPNYMGEAVGEYGKWARLLPMWREVSELARVRKSVRPMRWMAAYNRDFWLDVRLLERHGLSRGVALDWLFGELSIGPVVKLHPAMIGVLTKGVVRVMSNVITGIRWVRGGFESMVARAARILEEGLLGSDLVRKVYSW